MNKTMDCDNITKDEIQRDTLYAKEDYINSLSSVIRSMHNQMPLVDISKSISEALEKEEVEVIIRELSKLNDEK